MFYIYLLKLKAILIREMLSSTWYTYMWFRGMQKLIYRDQRNKNPFIPIPLSFQTIRCVSFISSYKNLCYISVLILAWRNYDIIILIRIWKRIFLPDIYVIWITRWWRDTFKIREIPLLKQAIHSINIDLRQKFNVALAIKVP